MKQLKSKRWALRCLYWAGSLQLLSDAPMQIYPQRWGEVTLCPNTSLIQAERREHNTTRCSIMQHDIVQPNLTQQDTTRQCDVAEYNMAQDKTTQHNTWGYCTGTICYINNTTQCNNCHNGNTTLKCSNIKTWWNDRILWVSNLNICIWLFIVLEGLLLFKPHVAFEGLGLLKDKAGDTLFFLQSINPMKDQNMLVHPMNTLQHLKLEALSPKPVGSCLKMRGTSLEKGPKCWV